MESPIIAPLRTTYASYTDPHHAFISTVALCFSPSPPRLASNIGPAETQAVDPTPVEDVGELLAVAHARQGLAPGILGL